ncbi:MAG: AbrB/MazE/SpoVT family DNA-binding domain-containing protein [Candidatus Hydrothermarchaeaceae archaeon]
MGISAVTRNFQVTLPRDVRERMRIKEGDKVFVDVDEDGKITMDIVKKSPVDESFGIWKEEVEGIEYTRKLRQEWAGG